MNGRARVVIDAGHGGDRDPGAVFEGRREKDDNLKLALAVGQLLADQGVDVLYTRVTDVFDTPYEKAQMANGAAADFFVSIHRNAAREPGMGAGTMVLVYERGGEAEQLAEAINRQMRRTSFPELGLFERPDLVVLRKTQMPAVLVEAGFIDNPEDNRRFDTEFSTLAASIADGILEAIAARAEKEPPEAEDYFYMIQTGLYRIRSLAEQQLEELKRRGFPAFLSYDGYYYRVRAGAFRNLDNAVRMEAELKRQGFPTVMVYEREMR